jgi:hypothetical protein
VEIIRLVKPILDWYHLCYSSIRSFISPLTYKLIINDLLGGRGWWLVKGALVRGPFLLKLSHHPYLYEKVPQLRDFTILITFKCLLLLRSPGIHLSFCNLQRHYTIF